MTSRKEVAKKLRKSGEYMGDFKKDHYYGFFQIVEDIGLDADDFFDEWELIRAKCNRLADLIDPTCKNKQVEINKMAPIEFRTDNFICSNCGEIFCADKEGINAPIDWSYCPSCGARVVRDEA